ncbi:uncharacterized protein LOC142591405 [Dermacentor variabilis]|uniref:uncharacterized protein LOC142591405 n=1 Tax=Dermacentor variabilis TaxID=34621 RepID=UPI003F5B98AD
MALLPTSALLAASPATPGSYPPAITDGELYVFARIITHLLISALLAALPTTPGSYLPGFPASPGSVLFYAPETVKVLIGKERMIRKEQLVDFQVNTIDVLMSVDIKTIDGIVPTEDAPKEFPHTYLVLKAEENCLLVSYGITDNGVQKCLLWGLSGSNVDKKTECYKALPLYCPENLYDMTETNGPCLQLDRDEERRNKKAQRDKNAH